jgi:predicted nucleotidyltransferase
MNDLTVNQEQNILGDKERLLKLCRQYDVASLRIFGSVARGEDNEGSDIDILVSFVRPLSLLRLIRFERELSELFGRQVDLVTEQALSPYIRSSVMATVKDIYELS